MKKLILILAMAAFWMTGIAQEVHPRPTRTPEEEAAKQTEMLQRELALTEQQYDTIYRIHLKYAKMRQVSNTRGEMLQRLNSMTHEVLNMLSPQQRKLFMGKQMDAQPRRPQSQVVRMQCDSVNPQRQMAIPAQEKIHQ
ncbi:MAG: hypothetical protein KBS77_01655 [Bacteroidales bacterium]|nr:hypothetical protein [Candidatus Colicola faecequi]